jgi:CHAT domain-containing protein/Tfp pilus assembly protein PilF
LYRTLPALLIAGLSLQSFGSANGYHKSAPKNAETKKESSQTDVRLLETNKPIERELKGGDSHAYKIALEVGQYLNLVVEQRGIDVVVRVKAPDGKQLMEVDSPNGTQGPEPISLIAEGSGDYIVIVSSLEKNAAPGRYEVKIIDLRRANDKDRALLEADRLDKEIVRLRRLGKSYEAMRVAEQAAALYEKADGSEHPDVAAALNDLAFLVYENGDRSRAESLFKRALSIYEKFFGVEHAYTAGILDNLGNLYYSIGEYKKAEPLFRRSLEIKEKVFGPNDLKVAYELGVLGRLYQQNGDYIKAEPLFIRSLAIRENALGADHPLVAASLNFLGILYRDEGRYEKVESLLSRALSISEKVTHPNQIEIATSLTDLAVFYQETGDYSKAESLYPRIIAIYEEAEHSFLAVALDNLGNLYKAKGDYGKAEALFLRALAAKEKEHGLNHPDVAVSLNNLANVYQLESKYEKVEGLYTRSLEILEKAFGHDHPTVASSLSNLGSFYESQKDYLKAEEVYLRSLAIRERILGAEHPSVAISLNNLATLYIRLGNPTKAEPLYLRALAIWLRAYGPNHPNVAGCLSSLAVLYQAKGSLAQAIDFNLRNAEGREKNLALNLSSGSERQRLIYLNQSVDEKDVHISLHVKDAPDNKDAVRLALTTVLRRKGRALDAMTDTIANLRRRASNEDQSLLDQLASYRSQLSVLTLRGHGKEGIEEHNTNLKAIEEKIENLEAQISQFSAEFRARLVPINLENVQRVIPKDSVLVEFVLYRPFDAKAANKEEQFGKPHYVAYLVRHQGEPTWAELGDSDSINKKIDAFRKAVRDRGRKDVNLLARSVDEAVMQPLRKLIGNTRHVFLCPDGALNLLPFAALVDERNHYLLESYLFTYLTSGRDLLRLQEKISSKQPMMILADPDFGEIDKSAHASPSSASAADGLSNLYFSRLERTELEAEELKKLFPQAEVLVREKATETAVKQARSPQILHIATHGFFLDGNAQLQAELKGEQTRLLVRRREGPSNKNDTSGAELINPLMRSGLGLAGANTQRGGEGNDGILTAFEATGLDLWGTKLVVLSACDTGVGEIKNGDGVYGLRRALVLAGSESQMMSLWPVSDRGTRELMIEYYRRLKADDGRSEALRQVQLRMLKDPNRRHPFYWASFIQSGEWANLNGKR